jgi:hypothetical protein
VTVCTSCDKSPHRFPAIITGLPLLSATTIARSTLHSPRTERLEKAFSVA